MKTRKSYTISYYESLNKKQWKPENFYTNRYENLNKIDEKPENFLLTDMKPEQNWWKPENFILSDLKLEQHR